MYYHDINEDKGVNALEWVKRMMDALGYMENKMDENLETEDIAKVACCSSFHFQRMFHMLTGVSVAEYIRKRRLTLAAQEISISSIKIIDIALKYGYDSPEAFCKAFKKLHGITPTATRQPGTALKAFPRISFHLSLKGDQEMNYKIIEKEAFNVVGKLLKVSTKNGENFKTISEFWQECCKDVTCERICSIDNTKNMLGICMDMENEKEQFSYMIAIEGENIRDNKDFIVKEIPASTWAVFTSIGPMPTAIQNVIQRIYQEWFPSTGYEHAGTAELEVYLPGDTDSEDYCSEVWIPIIKK